MTLFEDLVGDILTESGGAPEMIIERMLRNASMDFFDETWLWQDRLSLTSTEGLDSYQLATIEGTSIVRLAYCSYDGRELLQTVPQRQFGKHGAPVWYFLRDDALNLRPASHIRGGKDIEVELVYKPTRSATGIPTSIADKWFEVIQHGALAKILSMPTTPWYDPQRAGLYMQQYMEGLIKATREGKRLNHSRVMTTRFNW